MDGYADFLKDSGLSENTIKKYLHDAEIFSDFLADRNISPEILNEFKAFLLCKYPPTSVKSTLIAVNKYLDFLGEKNRIYHLDIRAEAKKSVGLALTSDEYFRLLKAAKNAGDDRLYMLIETVCSAGLQVSELKFITVKAVFEGKVILSSEKSAKEIYLPKKLCEDLRKYCERSGITSGFVFVTRGGKPLDRSNIWRDMKKLCAAAEVPPEKVFPQKLKELYSKRFEDLRRDTIERMGLVGWE